MRNVFAEFKLELVRFLEKIITFERGMHYVNGLDSLPAPLSSEEEAEALELADTDNEMRSKLIEHNLRLVVYIAKRFESTGVSIEDLISIGSIGLIKAINTFKLDKNIKLATYAARCIENEILMYLRRASNQRVECSLDEPLSVDWDGNELLISDILGTDEDEVMKDLECEEEKKVLLDAVARLSEKERLIVNMRFGLNGYESKTQKDVADILGISQSYISRLEKRILKRLRREISSVI